MALKKTILLIGLLSIGRFKLALGLSLPLPRTGLLNQLRNISSAPSHLVARAIHLARTAGPTGLIRLSCRARIPRTYILCCSSDGVDTTRYESP